MQNQCAKIHVLIDTQRTEIAQLAVLMSIILMSTLNILKHTVLRERAKSGIVFSTV